MNKKEIDEVEKYNRLYWEDVCLHKEVKSKEEVYFQSQSTAITGIIF